MRMDMACVADGKRGKVRMLRLGRKSPPRTGDDLMLGIECADCENHSVNAGRNKTCCLV